MITDGAEFDADALAGRDLTIAVTVPDGSPLESSIGSLVLDLNAGAASRTENVEPYALFGDRNGDLSSGDNGAFIFGGRNTVELEAFEGTRGRGDLLESLTLDFTIRDDLPVVLPVVSIAGPSSTTEGAIVTFVAQLDQAAAEDVTVSYELQSDSATVGTDVVDLGTGQVVISRGNLSGEIAGGASRRRAGRDAGDLRGRADRCRDHEQQNAAIA